MKSFTILEAIIGMLVSSVILLVTLYVYQLVSRSFIAYQAENQQKTELFLLKKVISQDFQNCDFVIESKIDDKSIIINGREQIFYNFLPDKIIRLHPNRSDTFFIETTQIESFYIDSVFKLITTMQFSLSIKNEKIPLLFSKRYSAVQLLKGENKIKEGYEY
ncbi:hypothetical protein IQ13_0903 [Lacibacter cauensis]|uniref:Prepilin-type N-terminal cleavage/methylation domain-containing protein n=1 Tax=Lacibacter cauensis TaxID=510947 RepID=A0A562SXJ4_9BACT|nr:hypothetical protein [Lacibacter cauensis]TWI85738.1 hypothetical protein IQ13_0903 [Lacibacter cauensis]